MLNISQSASQAGSIPDDLAEAFARAFEREDKDAVIAGLMRKAVEEGQRGPPRSGNFVERSRRIRASGPHVSDEEIRRARQELRDESFENLVAQVLRRREEPPYFTDEDIRRAREEPRH